MADPLAPTVPETPRRGRALSGDDDPGTTEDGAAPADDTPPTAAPAGLAQGAPVADPLERAVARAKAAAALFGETAAVLVGRYRLIELNPVSVCVPTSPVPAFIPLKLPTTRHEPAACDIKLELRKGAVSMTITWPASAAGDLAHWTRTVLG